MNVRNNSKERIYVLLSQGTLKSSQICKRIGCCQSYVSKVKKKWDKMTVAEQEEELRRAEEILQIDLSREKARIRKIEEEKKKRNQEVKQNLNGFRTPYSAVKRSNKTYISRY